MTNIRVTIIPATNPCVANATESLAKNARNPFVKAAVKLTAKRLRSRQKNMFVNHAKRRSLNLNLVLVNA
jgi:hypothetical protein